MSLVQILEIVNLVLPGTRQQNDVTTAGLAIAKLIIVSGKAMQRFSSRCHAYQSESGCARQYGHRPR